MLTSQRRRDRHECAKNEKVRGTKLKGLDVSNNNNIFDAHPVVFAAKQSFRACAFDEKILRKETSR